MTKLTLKGPRPESSKRRLMDYISKLSPTRQENFFKEIMYICIAYYSNADWHMTARRIANKYTVGSQEEIRKHILSIDEELIERFTQDFIQHKGITQ